MYVIALRHIDLYELVSLDSVKVLKALKVTNEELCQSSNEDWRLKIRSKAAQAYLDLM